MASVGAPSRSRASDDQGPGIGIDTLEKPAERSEPSAAHATSRPPTTDGTPPANPIDTLTSRHFGWGLFYGLIAAAAFGASGGFAKGLLIAGWSPTAAVTWRVGVGALALLVPGILAMRGNWGTLRRGWPKIVLFGLVGVALCQLAYFLAIQRLPVAVSLLLEYLGVVFVVGWLWLRRGQRPRPLTIVGSGLAILGLLFVLDVFGAITIDLIGVVWGLVAAVGLASYFLISADESDGLPAMAVAAGGLLVGALLLLATGLLGLTQFRWSTTNVVLAGYLVPWWVAVLALALVAAALAYATGVMSSRRLGSKLASFVGLSEVLFAVLWAFVLLGEMPGSIQLLGGTLIFAGVVFVKLDEGRGGEG